MAHSMTRITRTEMLESWLPDLGVGWTDSRTLRGIHSAIGIESEKRSRSGERGGVVCYERPVSALTITSVDFRVGSSPSGSLLLEPFRELSERYLTDMGEDPPYSDLRVETNAILELDDDIDFVAELLLIGSPDLGMDPATRNDLFEETPRLMRLLGEERLTIQALYGWDAAYLAWAGYSSRTVRRTLAQKRDAAAEAFLKFFGNAILEYRDIDKRWPPLMVDEGGEPTSSVR